MRHSVLILTATISLLGLSACQRSETAAIEKAEHGTRREPVRVISKLDCPEKQGRLTRTAVAPDGLSCGYAGSGAEILLRLVTLNGGDAEQALAPIETELKALMPPVRSVAEQGGAAKAGQNKTSIHLPGVHIDASDDGADIKIGQLTINSEGGAAEVKIDKNVTVKGGKHTESVSVTKQGEEDADVNIRATDDGAEIRQSKMGDTIRSTLILASDKAPSGYRVVGYEARGPKGGPIAVATVKAKDRNSGDHDVFKDMKALVRHNVGG